MYKTQAEVRNSFWDLMKETNPDLYVMRRSNKRQNDYNATIRTFFCDHVDCLRRDGQISEKLANSVTL